MTNEINYKYKLKRKLSGNIKSTTSTLHHSFTPLLKLALYSTINKAVKSYEKSIATKHNKKLHNLQAKSQHHPTTTQKPPQTVHNFSSHALSTEEHTALSYTLDQHIPPNKNPNAIHTEFERFYQGLVRNTTSITEEEKSRLKTKLRNSCDRYSQTSTPYAHRKIASSLAKNRSIKIIKQDKGRGVIILNNELYIEKCKSLLSTNQFSKLNKDPTRKTEGRVQRVVRKIKADIPSEVYQNIYPTGSSPGKFYGTGKLHKLKPEQNEIHLPLRPIVSNIKTSTYHLAKYLAKLIQPLGKSAYTITSTEEFVHKWRNKIVPPGHNLISFDVVSLFTNVPLDKTIDIVLRRIYDENAIQTNIKWSDLKHLLLLCTKIVHFTFDNETYIQTDGVAMGSPLGSILSDICMVELENTIIPILVDFIKDWSRFVDNTIGIVRDDSIDNIMHTLNSFHPSIQFTFETEVNNKIPFLDVMLIRNETSLTTTVYRKPTNNDIYIHWDAFAPESWKRGTLKTLTRRAYSICSTTDLLHSELQHIRQTFHTINGYPHNIITQIFQSMTINPTPLLKHDHKPSNGTPLLNHPHHPR